MTTRRCGFQPHNLLADVSCAVRNRTYDPVRSLDEADGGDVSTFLLDWYPRKAMWASKTNTRSYMASFRKFFKFMAESKRFDPETVDELRSILKENKEEFLDAVDDDGSDDYW